MIKKTQLNWNLLYNCSDRSENFLTSDFHVKFNASYQSRLKEISTKSVATQYNIRSLRFSILNKASDLNKTVSKNFILKVKNNESIKWIK